jgi:tetratricopeptide (TPR) repeat protein
VSEQPQVNQTGLKDVLAGRDINANIDLSVNKTVIHEAPKINPPIPDNVPISTPNFVGRVKELEDIHAKLQGGQGVSVCAVEGMGGLGKSELARRYAWEYRQEYAARYWFSLREGRLADEVVKLAKSGKLDLPEVMHSQTVEAQAEWCWQNWTPTEGKVLVILDDVNDLASIPEKARPMADRFCILVTTRKRKLHPYFADIPLKLISKDEALELLAKFLGAARVDREEEAAKAICEYLGCLPLGVELAGRYLQLDEDLRLSDYQQRLTIADESLDLQETEEINATRGVIAAFELSWQELSAGTGKLAMLLGLFDPADIAWGLVEEIAAQLNIAEGELREGRKQLNNLYLIKAVDKDRSRIAVHSLTRQFLQWKLAQEPDTNCLFRETFVMSLLGIAKEIPESPTRDLIAKVSPAIPHLDMLSREMRDDIPNPEEDSNLLWVFAGIARFYVGQALYVLAEDPWQRCLKITQELFGDCHRSVATILNNLAMLYYFQGKYREAEPLFLQALALIQELLGESHPDLASSLNNLSELYKSQGRYGEAETLRLRCLEIQIQTLGEKHPQFLSSRNNLGALYYLQWRYDEAELIFVNVLEIRREILGDHHPDVAQSLNNLAGLYDSQERYKESELLYQQALALMRKHFGNRHPNVATSLHNLAESYRSQGKYDEAVLFHRQSLILSQDLFGEYHPDVASSLNNLAKTYFSLERYDEAEPLYQKALILRKELLSDNHRDIADSLTQLADLYHLQRRYREAKPLLKQALQMWEKVLGLAHPITMTVRANYVKCLQVLS